MYYLAILTYNRVSDQLLADTNNRTLFLALRRRYISVRLCTTAIGPKPSMNIYQVQVNNNIMTILTYNILVMRSCASYSCCVKIP